MYRPIFIIGRFRSGTSMLWNLFNVGKRFLPFYEPLHEALPLLVHKDSNPEVLNHQKMGDKFAAYKGVPSDIMKLHSTLFSTEKLFLEKIRIF